MGVKINNQNVIALRIGNTPIVKRYINGSIVYRSVVPEVTDYDILAVYNVDDTSSATRILSNINHVEYAYLNDRPIDVAMDYAFAQSGTYTLKVKLQDKIDSVPSYSFKSCKNLVSVDISARLTVLGTEAFYGCTNLTSVTLPDTLTAIYADAFYNCNSLTSIEIPTTVTEIGSSAFENCSNLKSIVIPEGVTTIELDTFNSCHRLRNVVIPSSVTSIGARAFTGCRYLPSIIIPENVTSIGESAFYYCPELIQITCNATTAPILGTRALTSLSNANDGVLYYPCGSDYSSWMTQLNQNPTVWTSECIKGELEYNVTMTCMASLDEDTYFLNDVSRVEKMEIDGVEVTPVGNKTFNSGVHTIKVKFSGNTIPSNTLYTIMSIDISEDIETIETGAFQLANKLTSVTVSSYNKYYTAQDNCVLELLSGRMIAGVGEFTIPEDVTSIGERAAWNNDFITNISIPDSVTTIEDSAFGDCSSMLSVTIGSGVTSVGNGVFTRCGHLSSITCNATTAPTINGYLDEWVSYGEYSIAAEGTFNYPCGSDYSTWLAQLPAEWVDGCTSEEPSYDVTATVVVTSTTSTTALAKAISGMSAMFIDGVEVAPTSAYTFSTTGEHTVGYNFTSTSLPSNVYSGCSTITEIVIGDRITSLASGNASIVPIQGTFGNMPSLGKVTIGNGITSLNAAYGGFTSKVAVSAFGKCPSLMEINLGESITAITGPVFMGCEYLSSITIPSSVQDMSDYVASGTTGEYGVFQGCTSLKEVTFEGTTAPSIDVHTFPNGNAGTFYYPCGSDYSAVASQLSMWTDGCGGDDDNTETPVEYDIDIEFDDYLEFKVNNRTITATESPYHAMLSDVGVSTPEEITSYSFDSSATNSKVTKINKLPFTNKIMNTVNLFNSCQFLTEVNIDGWDLSGVKNANFMFAYCGSLTSIVRGDEVVESFGDTFSPTSTQGMFGGCNNLVNIPYVNCHASTNTSYMFYECQKVKTITLPDTLWYVETTNQMFDGCYELETISSKTITLGVEFGANWNMSISNRWTSASAMFRNCYALKQLPFRDFNTSFYKLEDVSQMLMNCRTITSVNLDSRNDDTWSDLKYIRGCFAGCYNLHHIGLTPWDLTSGNITNVNNLFDGDFKLEYVDFNNWNLDNVTDYSSMFNGCSALYALNFDNTPSCTTYDLMQSALEEAGIKDKVMFNGDMPDCGGNESGDWEQINEYTYVSTNNGEWTTSDDDHFPYAYESVSNYNVDDSVATMYIKLTKANGAYGDLNIGCRNDSEYSYDYVMVSQPNVTIDASTDPQDDTQVLITGYNVQNEWVETVLNWDEYDECILTVIYRKDSSSNDGADKGYVSFS